MAGPLLMGDADEMERLGRALDALAAVEPEIAQVVDLKFFCGFTFAEIASLRGGQRAHGAAALGQGADLSPPCAARRDPRVTGERWQRVSPHLDRMLELCAEGRRPSRGLLSPVSRSAPTRWSSPWAPEGWGRSGWRGATTGASRGWPRSSCSFTDNGDGTITDNNTGLMWEKEGDNGGLHDKDNGYQWSGNGSQETIWDWLDDVNAEGGTGFAGHNDWRIPNIKELQSLVNFQRTAPTISAAFNAHCVAGATVLTGSCTLTSNYTSSTTWPANHTMAASVSFNGGILSATDRVAVLHVRAVRGGKP